MIYYATKYPYELVFVKMIEMEHRVVPAKVGMFFFGMPVICWTKSEALDELFVTKNAFFTKHEISRSNQRPLTHSNIVIMDSDDPSYKKKRKAISGAFFKSKMDLITKIVK